MSSKENEKIIKVPQTVTIKKLGLLLNIPVSTIITELLKNKILATINEEIDYETASIIAQDLGFETEQLIENDKDSAMTLEKLLEICKTEKESGKNLQTRPPIVTILGHVDHGKTTLLDTIRKTSIAEKEAGGITQHISAYQTKKKGKLITFVDTPGHEAFSGMRERGVSIADIAVLVVAADDGVRPQTKEVIAYLKEKKIPTVVAINKIDKPEINLQKVKQELADNDILIEQWGGKYICSEVSAKNNIGIDDLLENILLLAEIEDFKADEKRNALGIVLESHLDPHKGPVATILVKTGTLKVGQDVVVGKTYGRVRKIEDFTGKSLNSAAPSTPISIMGLSDTPNTNDILQVADGKTAARLKSKNAEENSGNGRESLTSQNMLRRIEDEKIQKLNIILKADVQGSLEAIEQILSTIKSDEVCVNYLEIGVGSITESDIKIAAPSKAIIFGFNTQPTPVAKRLAEANEVQIKTYRIIYELVAEIKDLLSALLPPEIIRTDFGKVEVLAIFKNGKKEMIVGGKVKKGKIVKNSRLEVWRDERIIGHGIMTNLQQNKIPADEVKQNNECGLVFEGETKLKVGDILASYHEQEKPKSL